MTTALYGLSARSAGRRGCYEAAGEFGTGRAEVLMKRRYGENSRGCCRERTIRRGSAGEDVFHQERVQFRLLQRWEQNHAECELGHTCRRSRDLALVDTSVAACAKSDQILLRVVAGLAAKCLVVNLKIRHGAATLASPTVST
jgi:hypothetical protein